MAVRKNNPNIPETDAIPGTYGQLHALTEVSQATGSNAPFYDALSGIPTPQVLDNHAKIVQKQQQEQHLRELESMQAVNPEEVLLGMGGGPYDAPPPDPLDDIFDEELIAAAAEERALLDPQYGMDWLTDFLWPDEPPVTYEEWAKQIDPEWSAEDYQFELPDLSSIIASFTDPHRLESMAGQSVAGILPTGQYPNIIPETMERTGMSIDDFNAQQSIMDGMESEIEQGIPGGTFFLDQISSDPAAVQSVGAQNYIQFFNENPDMFDPSISAQISQFFNERVRVDPVSGSMDFIYPESLYSGEDLSDPMFQGGFSPTLGGVVNQPMFTTGAGSGDEPITQQGLFDPGTPDLDDPFIVYDRDGEPVQVGTADGAIDAKSLYFQPTESDLWTLQYRNVPHAVRYYTDDYEGQLRNNADLLFHIYQPANVIEAGGKPEGDKAYNDALSQWYGAYLQQGQTGFRSLLEAQHGSLHDRLGDIVNAFEAYEKDPETYSSKGQFFSLVQRFHPLSGDQGGPGFYNMIKYLASYGLEGSPQQRSVANAAYEDARARRAQGELPSEILKFYMPSGAVQKTTGMEEGKRWEGKLENPYQQEQKPGVPSWWTARGRSSDQWLNSEEWQKSVWEQENTAYEWNQMQNVTN